MNVDLLRDIEENPTRVVVVGGGAAGLVAAREMARPGFDVVVLEAREALGGAVAACEVAGTRLDCGAESFAVRGGEVAALLKELRLEGSIVQPNPAGSWLQTNRGAVPSPRGGILGIPSVPLAKDVIAAIGWRGALRAWLDRLAPVLKIGQEHDLARLVGRRMGRAVLDNLVAPVTGGVYSAPPDALDTAAAIPGLNPALTRSGSLSGAVALLRENAKPGSLVSGIEGGMARLVDALAADARSRGARLLTGVEVVGIMPADAFTAASDAAPADDGPEDAAPEDAAPEDSGQREPESDPRADSGSEAAVGARQGVPADAPTEVEAVAAAFARHAGARWCVTTAGGDAYFADAVLVALPQQPALELVGSAHPDLAAACAADWPRPTRVEVATLVVDEPALDAAPRGTGILVSAAATGIRAKALTHSSAKWPWLAASLPAGRHALRLSYGRSGDDSETADLADDQLRAVAIGDASQLLGVPLRAEHVVGWARTRWSVPVPLAVHGQRERVAELRRAVGKVDGLEIAGAWVAGTGLASVVPDARHSAELVRGLRWRELTQNAKESP